MVIKVATKKNPDGSVEWTNLYSKAIRNRLRKDLNLADIPDIAEARKNLGIKDYMVSVSDDIQGSLKQYIDQQDLAFYELMKGYVNNTALPSAIKEMKAYHDENSGSGYYPSNPSDPTNPGGSGSDDTQQGGSYTSPYDFTITVEGVKANSNAFITRYGICRTPANIAEKTVTISNVEQFVLMEGSRITVKFTDTNYVENPSLSVNNSSSRPIYYRGYPVIAEALQANSTYDLVYNGLQWEIVGSILWTE